MSADDYSCIKKIEEKVHIPLPMSCAKNPASSVRDYLEKWKCRYIPLLEGLVVDFDKVTFESPLGRIIDDQAYLHYDIKAEFSIFKPSVGDLLKGVVNRISREHIGCVVHNSINATINISDDVPSDARNFFGLDSTILFEVTNIDVHRKVIRVEGKLTKDCIELTRNLFPEHHQTKHLFFNDHDEKHIVDRMETTEGMDYDNSSKQKRKSKKRKRESIDSPSTSGLNDSSVINSFSNFESSPLFNSTPASSKPKKKKKRKIDHEGDSVDYVSRSEFLDRNGAEFDNSKASTSMCESAASMSDSTLQSISYDASQLSSNGESEADGSGKKKKKKDKKENKRKKGKKKNKEKNKIKTKIGVSDNTLVNSKSEKKPKKHSKKQSIGD